MLGLILSLSMAANAGGIDINKVTASSSFSSGNDVYSAKNVHAGKVGKAWVEDDKGSGLGSWLELALEKETEVTEIHLWNGNWYSFNEWDYYNRISKLEVVFSNGKTEKFDLKNTKSKEVLTLKSPIKTSSVKFIIRGVHSGSTYSDRTALSEVKLFNSSAEKFAVPVKFDVSSVSPKDNDGSYIPENLIDGIADTSWCEKGDKAGKGEWFEYDFGTAKSISSVDLVNGYAAGAKVFFAYGRVKKGVLHFDDGSTHQIDIKTTYKPQSFSFPAVKTRKVKFELLEVSQGKKVPKVCLSEAIFK
jgi:hypothetical protein